MRVFVTSTLLSLCGCCFREQGKKFDKVNRLVASGTSFNCSLLLDHNSQIYPISIGEKVTVVLASTLSLDGSPDSGAFDQSLSVAGGTKGSLADNYDYVTHGIVYLYKHLGSEQVEVQVSFGGLLMRIQGGHDVLKQVEPDMQLYCLMKKG